MVIMHKTIDAFLDASEAETKVLQAIDPLITCTYYYETKDGHHTAFKATNGDTHVVREVYGHVLTADYARYDAKVATHGS